MYKKRKKDHDEFVSTFGRGFQIKINGWVLSVQFGPDNYCEHYGKLLASVKKIHRSRNAEIAIIGKHAFLPIGKDNETVVGWVYPRAVVEVLNVLATTADTTEILRKVKRLLATEE